MAVEDGRIVGIGASRKLGHYVVLRDTYGDLFTYAGLGSIAPRYRLPKPTQVKVPTGSLPSGESASDPTPKLTASPGHQLPVTLHVAKKKTATSGQDSSKRSLLERHSQEARRYKQPVEAPARCESSRTRVTPTRQRPHGSWQRVRPAPRTPPTV